VGVFIALNHLAINTKQQQCTKLPGAGQQARISPDTERFKAPMVMTLRPGYLMIREMDRTPAGLRRRRRPRGTMVRVRYVEVRVACCLR
jgi:hypothetical protein